jgi:hypothetical protein
MVLFEGVEEVTCQCCGLHTIEVKLCHTAGRNGALNWESRLGLGMTGVCLWQYSRCSPHLEQCQRSLLVDES